MTTESQPSQPSHNQGKPIFVEVAIAIPLRRTFEYSVPQNTSYTLAPGMRVQVTFSGRTKIAIIVKVKDHSDFESSKIKPINMLVDESPIINQNLIKLTDWMIRYYHAPPGEVWQTVLPTALMKGQSTQLKRSSVWKISDKGKVALEQETLPKNAIKQRQTLVTLSRLEKTENAGADNDNLSQFDISKTTLKSLSGKGLVEQTYHSENSNKQIVTVNTPENLTLTDEQSIAISEISENLNEFNAWLLFGVTASGKTEVYLRVIEECLREGKQALVLVPEIGLTPQTVSRFKQRFNTSVEMLHSGMTEMQRLQVWLKARAGNAKIVIGTRSALFVPLKHPGIIIIDEEHDGSFKQQQGLRYSARDIAMVRATIENIPIVLGSASPSIETLMNVKKHKIKQLTLKKKAISENAIKFNVIDLKNQPMKQGLSYSLIDSIRHHVKHNGQVLLFLNRRGYSPVLLCHSCGFSSECKRCESHFTYHSSQTKQPNQSDLEGSDLKRSDLEHSDPGHSDPGHSDPGHSTCSTDVSGFLQCHHCGSTRKIPKQCPSCGDQQFVPVGLGTERLEETIKQLFPEQKTIRIDRDSTRKKSSMQSFVEEIKSGEVDILIGTQMLAKGHHFPKVTLVALIDMDGALYSSDFRAPEYAAQLITQVSGRAGRAEKPGEVIIQTHHVEHPMLNTLLNQGYASFANLAIEERIDALLPPHTFNALFQAEANVLGYTKSFLSDVKQVLRQFQSNEVELLGPVPAFYTKKAGKFRYQLFLESTDRKFLHLLLAEALSEIEKLESSKRVRWRLDIDPVAD